jgi:hypothetical protein
MKHAPVTIVSPGTIGVVVALDGTIPLAGQRLSLSVDCDSFQDDDKFLLNGGQIGRQPDVLRSGAYQINPQLFEVLTVNTIGAGKYGLTADDLQEIRIPEGSAGVVVTLEGAASRQDYNFTLGRQIAGHSYFQDAAVFLRNGGERGCQIETLDSGFYRINPWFARVFVVPCRDLILEWSDDPPKPPDNFDAELRAIRINVEGHALHVMMSQHIRIPRSSAPLLVQRFGELGTTMPGVTDSAGRAAVRRFVEKCLA